MFNVGGGELLVIMLIALIVLGPQRLPDAAKQVGRVVGDLRRISSGFQQELKDALDTDDSPTPLRRKESAPLAATVADADRRPARALASDTATGATTGAAALGAADDPDGTPALTDATDGGSAGRSAAGPDARDHTTVAPAVAAALDEVVAPLDVPGADGAPSGAPDVPTADEAPIAGAPPTADEAPAAGGASTAGDVPTSGDVPTTGGPSVTGERSSAEAPGPGAGRSDGPDAVGDERAAS